MSHGSVQGMDSMLSHQRVADSHEESHAHGYDVVETCQTNVYLIHETDHGCEPVEGRHPGVGGRGEFISKWKNVLYSPAGIALQGTTRVSTYLYDPPSMELGAGLGLDPRNLKSSFFRFSGF